MEVKIKGQYASHIISELIPEPVNEKFRTRMDREVRVIIGAVEITCTFSMWDRINKAVKGHQNMLDAEARIKYPPESCKNQYVVTSVRSEFGGTLYTIDFRRPPSVTDVSEAVKEIANAPFGWRVVTQRDAQVSLKIHND